MTLFTKKPPWYAAGLAFECVCCGNCCAGPEEGYVWVTPAEIAAIARHLGLSERHFRRRYVRRAGGRFSLIERGDNRDCIFLAGDGEGRRRCTIYPVRPRQCRTWPFWNTNLATAESWALAGMRCPGINRGAIVPCDEIDAQRNGRPR
jgi:hypothetical protein